MYVHIIYGQMITTGIVLSPLYIDALPSSPS